MPPDRKGYQPPILDNDQSVSTMDFAASRPVHGASRTFGEVAQALNLGEQDTTEWIQVPRSTRVTHTERSEAERIRVPRPTQATNDGRSEAERIRVPRPTQVTNDGRSEAERICVPRPTQVTNDGRSEAERIRVPRPAQVTNQRRSESLPTHISRFIQGANERRNEFERMHIPILAQITSEGRSESPPIEVSLFLQGTSERRNESERARFLDPRLDQLGQGRPNTRRHEDEGRRESSRDVFQRLIWSMKPICVCFIDRLHGLLHRDLLILQVLFLISLQLLVIAVLTMVCLRKDSIADSLVHSHKWVLGLSFSMCFSVFIARGCCKESFSLPPIRAIMFLIWSAGVILTVSWITILLSFDFLSLVICFLWLWTASILVSGFIFAQPLISYGSVLIPLCVVAGSAALFITVGSKSIMSVSFASFVSMLFLMYLLWRLFHLLEDTGGCSESTDVFYVATCIIV